MKTSIKAAIVLLSGTIFFSQASLAGRPDNKPPPKDNCVDFVLLGTACTDLLAYAHNTLSGNQDDFKNEKDFFGLSCKVVSSEIKMLEDKPADAFLKLEASFEKVWTLVSQRKLEKTAAYMIANDIAAARDCAEAQIPTTP